MLRRGIARAPSGDRVNVRLLAPGETDTILRVFGGLTPEQKWQRFHTGMANLPESVLRALADVDQRTRVALVLELDGAAVGIGRYVVAAAGRVEVALCVVAEHTGRGLGSMLADALLDHAVRNGVREVEFAVLTGNEPALRLARARGAELIHHGSSLRGRAQLDDLKFGTEPAPREHHRIRRAIRRSSATGLQDGRAA